MKTWEKQNIPKLSIYSNCLIVGWLNLWKPPLHCTQCYPGHGGSQVLWLPCWAIITWYHESQIATPDCSAVLVPVCVNIMTGSGCPHCPPSWWPWWPTSTAASTWPCASCQCGGQWPVMVSQVSTGVLVAVVGTIHRSSGKTLVYKYFVIAGFPIIRFPQRAK